LWIGFFTDCRYTQGVGRKKQTVSADNFVHLSAIRTPTTQKENFVFLPTHFKKKKKCKPTF
jgi:hypothetical protein